MLVENSTSKNSPVPREGHHVDRAPKCNATTSWAGGVLPLAGQWSWGDGSFYQHMAPNGAVARELR